MGRPRKYNEAFIRRALELVELSERPRCQVATDIGVSDTTLANWMKRFGKDNSGDGGLSRSERKELEQLRKEKREWLLEREILKKATAVWVKEIDGNSSGS